MSIEQATERRIEKITDKDLKPERIDVGGIEIILQRNAKDNRDLSSPLEMGALMPEAKERARAQAKAFFEETFARLGEEAETVDIIVVAADTKLETPIDGVKSDRKRAVDTAQEVIAGLTEAMEQFSLKRDQLLNKTGEPLELSSGRLRDLRIFEDSPEFVDYLKGKYGSEKGFWVAYEVDKEKEVRLSMGAEGPEDIADRIHGYIKVLSNAMKSYIAKHPGRRVIVWAVGHYDCISPYAKKYAAQMSETAFLDEYFPVDQGGGMVLVVGKDDNAARTTIQGIETRVSLE